MTPAGTLFTILVVDDESTIRAYMSGLLQHFGHQVIEADSADSALEKFKQHRPDLVLLDVVMPKHDGFWLAKQLRVLDTEHWTPIIFLSGCTTDEDLAKGIEAGGDDYLVKPVTEIVLRAKLHAVKRLIDMQSRLVELTNALQSSNMQLQTQNERDTLTGLLNRRGFDDRISRSIGVARRNRSKLTLMLCDLDHFKCFNDTSGHLAGDECLRQVGRLLQQICRRPADVAARYGGEEFVLILPDTPSEGALMFSRAILRAFELAAIPHPASPTAPYVTLSGGITTCIPDENTTAEVMLKRADDALYLAKSHGRNCFFSAELQASSSLEHPALTH